MYINNLGHMSKMAAMHVYGKTTSKIFFGFNLTWLLVLGTGVIQLQHKSCPCDDNLFYSNVNIENLCISWGKLSHCHLR